MARASLRFGAPSSALLALLALALPASPAQAQCMADGDCRAGEVCEALEKPVIDCPAGETCPTPPDEPITEGECVGAPCTADGECPDGMGCELGDGDSSAPLPTCPRDSECPTPEPAAAPEGRCEPQTISCQDDGDCPTGLTCVEEDGGDRAVACTVSVDGGVECEDAGAPEPATRACGFALLECDDDRDCTQEGYACIVVETKTSCPDVPCSADGVCPEPTEADCMPVDHRLCFPARVDCAVDSECADGWTCFALPDDLREDAPVSYEGATDVCFPEGVALAIDGTIALADAGGQGSSSASDSSGGGKATSGELDPDSSMSPEASDASGKSDDGCNVAVVSGRGSSAGSGAGVLGFLLASALSRARRRRASRARS